MDDNGDMNINNSNGNHSDVILPDMLEENEITEEKPEGPDFDVIQRSGGMLGLTGRDKANIMKKSIKMRKKPTRAGLRESLLVTGPENIIPTTTDNVDGNIETGRVTNGHTEESDRTEAEDKPDPTADLNSFPVLPHISPRNKTKEQKDFMSDLQKSLKLPQLKATAKNPNHKPEAKSEQPEARLSPSLLRKVDQPKPPSEPCPEVKTNPSPHNVKLEPISDPPKINVTEEQVETTPSTPIITLKHEEPEEMKTDEVNSAIDDLEPTVSVRNPQSSPALKKKVMDTIPDSEKARPIVKLRKTNNSNIFSAEQSNNDAENKSTDQSSGNENGQPAPKPLVALKPLKATLPVSVSDEIAKPLAQVKLRKPGARPMSQIIEPTNQNSEPEFIRRAREKRERNSLIIEQSQSQENSQSTETNNAVESSEPQVQVQLRKSPRKEGGMKPAVPRKPSQPVNEQDGHTNVIPGWKKELNSKNTKRIMHRYSSIDESGAPVIANKPTEEVKQSDLNNGENSPPVWRKELKRLSRGNSRGSLQMETNVEETDDQPEFIKLFKQRQSRLKKAESREFSD